MSNNNDVRPEDALQVAQRALQKVNEQEETIEAQQEELEDLRGEVRALSARTVEASDFDDLDRDTRVGAIREHIINRAQEQGGRAALDYNGVMWEVFDGEPSKGYCYKLMRLAAQGTGYGIRDPAEGNKQLIVNLDAMNDAAGVSRVNTSVAEGGR